MSAPDTNTEKQEKKHKGQLGGIAFSVFWGVLLLIGLIVFVILSGDEPVGADERVDGRTGEVVVVPED